MKETPKQRALLDNIAAAFKATDPERLRSAFAKDVSILFRVTESDRESMRETAKSLGLTLTDYLTRLHLFAVEVLAKHSKGGK